MTKLKTPSRLYPIWAALIALLLAGAALAAEPGNGLEVHDLSLWVSLWVW